jgi:hypothetical protein
MQEKTEMEWMGISEVEVDEYREHTIPGGNAINFGPMGHSAGGRIFIKSRCQTPTYCRGSDFADACQITPWLHDRIIGLHHNSPLLGHPGENCTQEMIEHVYPQRQN